MSLGLKRFVLTLLGCAFFGLPTPAAVTKPERSRVQGTDYVSLPAWAAGNRFNLRWLKRDGGGGWFAGNRNDEKNQLLAYQIQKSLVRNLRAEDRGVRRARFAVLRDAVMPAVLVEAGFMSHPSEGRKIFDAGYRREMARAIVSGIQAYRSVVE